jgi:hypothetical protein
MNILGACSSAVYIRNRERRRSARNARLTAPFDVFDAPDAR